MLHLSGITPALGDAPTEAIYAGLGAAKANGLTVSFDGNYRESLWQRRQGDPRALLEGLVVGADIFFGDHRDISLLLGREFRGDGPERRREAAEAAFRHFPGLRMIASTARHVVDADRHRISARIDTSDDMVQADEVEVSGIVDRIGSGDAFAAGVLHGVRLGRDLDWTVNSGLALACLKHSLPGDASLFGPADVEAFMAGARDVRR
jgi:2-dehydro-3-deoxygluconokinase